MTRGSRDLERRLDEIEEQLALAELEDDPTDLWRAFIEGEMTLEEWKESAKQ